MLAAVAGALSVIAQAVLVRELAVLFRNNELVLGILLGAWLAGSAAGAAGLGRLPAGWRWRSGWLLFAQMLLVLADVFAIRWLFGVWQFHARPPLPVVGGVAFALTAPAGALAGLTFASLAVFRSGPLASAIYVAEAAGACLGGLAFAALLAAGWHAIDVSLAALFVVLVFLINPGRVRPWGRLAASLVLPALGLWLCLPLLRAADDAGRRLQYRKTPLVFSRESRWGHLALTGGPGSGAFYYNGEVIVQRDLAAEEEETFCPVLAAGVPSSILVLGFCPDTLLAGWQALGVRRITAVFQDELMMLFEDYGAGRRAGYSFSPRFADPFRWSSVVRDRYDLVVIREPLPVTIAANRFFARSFYEGIKGALASGGVVAVAVPYEENGLDVHTARALAIVQGTLGAVFPAGGVVAAGRFWFFASDKPLGLGLADARRRLAALPGRPRFVNAAWVAHTFAPGRTARFTRELGAAGPVPVNGLFTMALFRDVLRGWVRRDLGNAGILLLIVLAGVVALAAARWRDLRSIVRRRPGAVWLAAAGFAGMAGEVELLFWYQGVTGVVYDLFALLTGFFMLGMAAGGRAALGHARGVASAGIWLAGWVTAVGALFLLPAPPGGGVANAVAFALSGFGGAALGAVFTGAARHREKAGASPAAVSGLYAADLAGSALAAVAVPALLVPGLGLPGTAIFAVAVLVGAHSLAGRHTWD
jgi:spermidine synthase